jgi:hypothetical protein
MRAPGSIVCTLHTTVVLSTALSVPSRFIALTPFRYPILVAAARASYRGHAARQQSMHTCVEEDALNSNPLSAFAYCSQEGGVARSMTRAWSGAPHVPHLAPMDGRGARLAEQVVLLHPRHGARPHLVHAVLKHPCSRRHKRSRVIKGRLSGRVLDRIMQAGMDRRGGCLSISWPSW